MIILIKSTDQYVFWDSIVESFDGIHLLGLDLLLDSDGKLWLLEVQSCPSLLPTSPTDLLLKGRLVETASANILDPAYWQPIWESEINSEQYRLRQYRTLQVKLHILSFLFIVFDFCASCLLTTASILDRFQRLLSRECKSQTKTDRMQKSNLNFCNLKFWKNHVTAQRANANGFTNHANTISGSSEHTN